MSPHQIAAARCAPLKPFETPEALTGLTDAALLSALLSTGVAEADEAASSLIERFGSLGAVLSADPGEVRRVGAPDKMLVQLGRLRELCVRTAREEARSRPVVSSWSQLLHYVRTAMAHLPREQFRTLYLDRRNVLIEAELVGEGTVDFAPVFPREVLRRALELNASSLILVHNHPAGDPTPSTADIEMTRKIVEAARVFTIQVHDHIIVGQHGTASFKALGLM